MARDGTIRQVTPEDMARMKRQMTALRNDLSHKILCLEEDFEETIESSKIAHCRAILDDIICYIADRDGVARADVSITALKDFRKA